MLTVAWNEKVLSPAARSPLVASSKKVWLAEPPMGDRSAVTASPVLVGPVPGVTATVSSVESPGKTAPGAAAPTPVGSVEVEQTATGDAVLRGLGAPSSKSEPLLSVSVHPPALRSAAVVLLVVGPTEPSKKLAPSHPIRSTMVARAAGEQGVEPPLHPSGVVVLTSATLPPPAAMLIGVESVTSGVGRGVLGVAPAASWISRYCPGARDPLSGVMRFVADPKLPVPVALVYWTDHPASDTELLPRLNSSMKSFV